ncbi:T9SS type A sorting domain-containing protein [Psychroserpens luteolus]|uniref:T9SS type A sorting domain-containing protein n=1 Tax=Psychroserpens luteolus TaxID=2855840 RepID=UPI001E550D18|nr:T9SS type A sorting domain-containing protein [Psychroserpens luteolus]MCD2260772.1 T9SS type A sorting domain-containing protein [Psychroserpens luteolus]
MKQLLLLLFTFSMTLCFSQKKSIKQNWDAFEKKYGKTIVQWKDKSESPHRVICQPIKLSEHIYDAQQLEALLREFISSNQSIFNIEDKNYRRVKIQKAKHLWYAHFAQTYEGKVVLNSELIFRVHTNGNLVLFGMEVYDIPAIESNNQSTSTIEQSIVNTYPNEKIKIEFLGGLKILPIREGNTITFKSAYELFITNLNDISEVLYVDANTTEILEKHSKIHNHSYDIQGSVDGQILPITPTDLPQSIGFPNLHVTIGGTQISTDENGNFDHTIAGSSAILNAELKGDFVSVSNFGSPDASITQTVGQNDVLNIVWNNTNSTLEERNVYYHINRIHQNNKQVDPGFNALDYPLQCIVNDTNANALCNAFWNGVNLHFGIQASNCSINSAHSPSTIYHEYGHATNDRMYNQAGVSGGMKNPILQEAFADIYSTLFLNDSRLALGWFGSGTFTRNLNNSNRYPANIVGQQHTDGLILGGAFWDLGLLTSPQTAYELAHYAKYGTPDDSDIAVAYAEVYFETLVADDDDGNLMNGTPNGMAIENAFCQHGIGFNLFASQKISHLAHENTLNTSDDYRIEISLDPTPFTSQLNISLTYSTNGFNSTNTVSFSQVNDTTFEAFIPSQSAGTLVNYYFSIPNVSCAFNILFHPSNDFLTENYSFYVGNYLADFEDDFEFNQGWQIGSSSDNATSGLWQRGTPQQTIDGAGFIVQPGSDHSPSGSTCLVTGATQGVFWYSNDVDTGKTTITSPVFNNLDDTSIIQFYKWFIHGAGFVFPVQGEWAMEISNNGTNWVTVESTNYGDHRYWINTKHKISDYVSVTNTIQVRFVVSDFGSGSIVEALVDDFQILTLSALSIDEIDENLDVSIHPNPAKDVVNFQFQPSMTSIINIEIFDVLGRKVEDIKANPNNSNHTITWNIAPNFSSGIYFAKINTTLANKKATKKIIIK